MDVQLETKGLDAILQKLDARADMAVRDTALSAQGKAAMSAPYDTGALSNSLHVEKVQDAVYDLSDAVHYGVHNELGTYKMAARPFVVPAIESERGPLESRLREVLKP